MHRMTPLTTAIRAYSAGGARSVVDTINDNPMMQEMAGNFMRSESRKKIEAPQNYGFSSVVMPAEKGKDGRILRGAEAVINFIGGNRSFPVATIMDDRRFRLKGLKPGDVGMFDHLQQQFLFNKDGAFLMGLVGKKIRMALAEPEKKQQQQQGGQQQAAPAAQTLGISTHEVGGEAGVEAPSGDTVAGGEAGVDPAAAQQAGVTNGGQTSRHGSTSQQYLEVNSNRTESMNKEHIFELPDGTAVHIVDGKVYLGAKKDKAMFARVKTESGISTNVYAKIG